MFSRFFIHRPIFASVLSIILTLAGGIALFTLPIAQYPEITPPTVEVSASYPGADAQVVAAVRAHLQVGLDRLRVGALVAARALPGRLAVVVAAVAVLDLDRDGHRAGYSNRRKRSVTSWPPKPKELEAATRTSALRATLGT